MKNKKLIWKILMLVSLVPFFILFIYGLISSVFGYSGLCILNCIKVYGFKAFRDCVISVLYVFWPIYIVSLFMTLLSLFMLKRK